MNHARGTGSYIDWFHRVKSGCSSSIPLAVSDPDGDDVRCRLAVGQECGKVCGIVPYGSLNEVSPS